VAARWHESVTTVSTPRGGRGATHKRRWRHSAERLPAMAVDARCANVEHSSFRYPAENRGNRSLLYFTVPQCKRFYAISILEELVQYVDADSLSTLIEQ